MSGKGGRDAPYTGGTRRCERAVVAVETYGRR